MVVDADAERLRHAVGGDVVVGRPDAAGGEHIGIAAAQGVQRFDDGVLVVGDDPDLFQVDADIGQVLGDIADVLVLGPARQNLVADHQDAGRDDLAHRTILLVIPNPYPSQAAWPAPAA